MIAIGARLRAIRQQWRLSLREVEQRSRRIARERRDLSYRVSANWLARIESGEHELTVNKLITLAEIYSIPVDQLIRLIDRENDESTVLDQPPSPDESLLLTGGLRESEIKHLLPDMPFAAQSPDNTTLLAAEDRAFPTPYRLGIIGTLDQTLYPMIPSGSIVRIGATMRGISPTKDWSHEFQRPIYFLSTKDGYVCGWCELDQNSEWLTLIPHPLSPAYSRRWKYQTEVENLGRVIAVAIRSGE
jgi:transcriptional regulator with XRE-family HTH domain